MRGSYVWGDDKVLDCKNRSSADVLKMAEVLRNSSGRKMLRFEKPVVSEKPSIQGRRRQRAAACGSGPGPPCYLHRSNLDGVK